jgi:hypothetical protein
LLGGSAAGQAVLFAEGFGFDLLQVLDLVKVFSAPGNQGTMADIESWWMRSKLMPRARSAMNLRTVSGGFIGADANG